MRKVMFLTVVLMMVVASQGEAAGPPGEVIKIGMVNDQTGANKGSGRGMKVGVDSYFKAVNEKGGVNGRKVELIAVDDQMVTDKTIDGLLKLVEEQKVFAVVGSVGTSNCVASLPIVKEYKLPFINPRTGASELRNPVVKEVLHIRASYQQEVDKIVDQLVKGGAKRFAVFYQNDGLGTDILSSTENAVKRHGLSVVSKGSFERRTTSHHDPGGSRARRSEPPHHQRVQGGDREEPGRGGVQHGQHGGVHGGEIDRHGPGEGG